MNRTEDLDKESSKASKNLSNDQSVIQSATIPVIEEKAKIGKRNVVTGKLRIDKKITEEEVMVDAPLLEEQLEVEHVAVNKYVEKPPPAIRQEDGTTIIPVLREVVEKRLLLIEELHITKRKVQRKIKEKVKLRKEEVTVEHVKVTDSGSSGK
jgi:stress response protein YsnF